MIAAADELNDETPIDLESLLAFLDTGLHGRTEAWRQEREALRVAHRDSLGALRDRLSVAVGVAGGRHSFYLRAEQVTSNRARAHRDFTTPTVVLDARGVAVVRVPSCGAYTVGDRDLALRYAADLADALDAVRVAGPRGWVIDLRGNTGGNMWPMLSGLAALFPDGVCMGFWRPASGQLTAITITGRGAALGGEVRVPVPPHRKIQPAVVAVAQDGRTMSSGEAVRIALRGLPGARTFGEATRGLTSSNTFRDLADGSRVVLTDQLFTDHRGRPVDEAPMAPDIAVASAEALQAATDWICAQDQDLLTY